MIKVLHYEVCIHVHVLRVQKGVSWVTIHSRSQGLLGVFGLSGVEEDFRERETETEEEKQRWAEIGCTASGQMVEEFVKKKKKRERRKHKGLI